MSQELLILLGSATAVGAVHTLLGPDHYVPFVVLSKARQWSLRKTLWIAALCGLGHVGSSVALGLIGIAMGITLRHLELIESQRGEIAAWLLMAFGLAYGTWGTLRALRRKPHTHPHAHSNGIAHIHVHTHHTDHVHPHGADGRSVTPWILFTIFVFGPCEPLIPLLMYPATALSSQAIVLVAVVFGAVTIATMTGVIFLSSLGLGFISPERLGRFNHSLAGGTIFLCGIAIRLGL
jgi:nickel/cobalt exporter